jgi:predicted DNA-binding transcriptional regulator YafY
MSINKNALLRYQILDRCFSNTGRGYTIDDLLEIVNEKLIDDDPKSSGIQMRQLREDIKFMRKESGFAAPIGTKPTGEGKKMFYYYEDSTFSINNSPLNETEAKQLKNALTLLNRFEGSPGFEWVSEIGVKLRDTFELKEEDSKVISFETNLDYVGEPFISKLFNAIVNKHVIHVVYKPFNSEQQEFNFHPYFLKQYNNRWFVFGLHEELDIPTWNLALDRIVCFEVHSQNYKPNKINWQDYFSEIYGVSKPLNCEEENIELLFSIETSPYIKTKPLHQSQKNYDIEDGVLVKLKLIPNFEFEQLILSYGENVEVIKPLTLREKINQRILKMIKKYE